MFTNAASEGDPTTPPNVPVAFDFADRKVLHVTDAEKFSTLTLDDLHRFSIDPVSLRTGKMVSRTSGTAPSRGISAG